MQTKPLTEFVALALIDLSDAVAQANHSAGGEVIKDDKQVNHYLLGSNGECVQFDLNVVYEGTEDNGHLAVVTEQRCFDTPVVGVQRLKFAVGRGHADEPLDHSMFGN